MASFNAKSKEFGESQDLYRRNLAAYWVAQPGELPADECIENIFAGGDGWASSEDAPSRHARKPTRTTKKQHVRKIPSRDSTPAQSIRQRSERMHNTSGVYGRASLEQHASVMKEEQAGGDRPQREVDELVLREDLRSWRIDAEKYTEN
jgi:hypothetical protein